MRTVRVAGRLEVALPRGLLDLLVDPAALEVAAFLRERQLGLVEDVVAVLGQEVLCSALELPGLEFPSPSSSSMSPSSSFANSANSSLSIESMTMPVTTS